MKFMIMSILVCSVIGVCNSADENNNSYDNISITGYSPDPRPVYPPNSSINNSSINNSSIISGYSNGVQLLGTGFSSLALFGVLGFVGLIFYRKR
jgi:hypothetical protein